MSAVSEIWPSHLARLKSGASQATAITEISRWISENTLIRGKPYSYKKREYQKRILDSPAKDMVIRKCSQIGISEIMVRKALGLCGMLSGFTTIYTLPTATLAKILMKTRVNTVIRGSPYLKNMISETDSVDVKEFGDGSFLYMNGAASTNAPISIPADCLIHDEVDFSDLFVLSQYQSRLTNSDYKMKTKLSTPTLPGRGIDAEFSHSKRHFNFAKCNHCGFYFIPDYYKHVRIPGYTGEIMDINKRNIHTIAHQEAFVECPKCGAEPNLGHEHREWVCENPGENHAAEGIQVSPFDVPGIITPGYLVESSTKYAAIGEFVNFNLGLPYFSQESVLSPDEIRGAISAARHEGASSYVMGVDMGKTWHFVVCACFNDGSMQVVHIEDVPIGKAKERYTQLRLQYRVRVTVIDSLPYTDMVSALQVIDFNLWACVYTQTKGTHLFTTKQVEGDYSDGTQFVRQINVARDRTFDALMSFMRSGQFSKWTCARDDDFVTHCTDMRRVKDWNSRTQTLEFRWLKSEDGNDHYFFALSYAFLARQIVGTFSGAGGGPLPLVSSFQVKQPPSNVL